MRVIFQEIWSSQQLFDKLLTGLDETACHRGLGCLGAASQHRPPLAGHARSRLIVSDEAAFGHPD